MLTITIFDVDGGIVSETTEAAQTATEAEIAEMVQIIEAGTPAWIASQIVCPSPSISRPHSNTPEKT